MLDDAKLNLIEKQHHSGLTSAEILDVFATHGIALSEATLRKYVQLGLLPRSVRVGKKGKHQGSQGIYPVSVVRQILSIKNMMAQSYTIEQIQQEFFFMRSDLQQLGATLDTIFDKIDRIVGKRKGEPTAQAVVREVREARTLSRDLVGRLTDIEARLSSRARMDRVAM
jgi:hypothetical protein